MICISCFNFMGFFMFFTFFSALCTVPEFVPDLVGAHSDDVYRGRFGIGSMCLMDLQSGEYNFVLYRVSLICRFLI